MTAAVGAGIGFATARRFTEQGARVLVSDRHEDGLARAVEELERLTRRRPPAVLRGITVQAGVDRLMEAAVRELGRASTRWSTMPGWAGSGRSSTWATRSGCASSTPT